MHWAESLPCSVQDGSTAALWLFVFGVLRPLRGQFPGSSLLWGSALPRLSHPPELLCASYGGKGGWELGGGGF